MPWTPPTVTSPSSAPSAARARSRLRSLPSATLTHFAAFRTPSMPPAFQFPSIWCARVCGVYCQRICGGLHLRSKQQRRAQRKCEHSSTTSQRQQIATRGASGRPNTYPARNRLLRLRAVAASTRTRAPFPPTAEHRAGTDGCSHMVPTAPTRFMSVDSVSANPYRSVRAGHRSLAQRPQQAHSELTVPKSIRSLFASSSSTARRPLRLSQIQPVHGVLHFVLVPYVPEGRGTRGQSVDSSCVSLRVVAADVAIGRQGGGDTCTGRAGANKLAESSPHTEPLLGRRMAEHDAIINSRTKNLIRVAGAVGTREVARYTFYA